MFSVSTSCLHTNCNAIETPKSSIFFWQLRGLPILHLPKHLLLMGAPSAGAEVLDILKVGHRVKVLGQQDVWLEIELDNQIGYVKNTQLKQLFF